MSDPTDASERASRSLPDAPNLEWLRREAKRRLADLRRTDATARLADAQFDVAKQYGFSSWRALKAHIDTLTVEGRLFRAATNGDTDALAGLLDQHPDKLTARAKPYDWSLLHAAAQHGHLAAVSLLLERGLDPNTRERGDNSYAMHWAAAAGHLDVVRRLADAGGDVVGRGDDHDLDIIGWATCWDGANDDAHRAIADFLVARGARHTIFSAIALNLAAEVRRIAAQYPDALSRRMSRNEDHQLPLHFAVRMNRPDMVALLLELGADPLATDGSGYSAAAYATNPTTDRRIMEATRVMTAAELVSAARGDRRPDARALDLVAALALSDWEMAGRLVRENPQLIARGAAASGVLHIMAKRNDLAAVRWLLQQGADPNARWAHWDADVTPLHLAALGGHSEVARVLLDAGADPQIQDSKHDANALDWARFFRREELVRTLEARLAKA